MLKGFLTSWQENRRRASEQRKKTFTSRVTDIILIILVVFVGCSYLYSSITHPPKQNRQEVKPSINSENGTKEVKPSVNKENDAKNEIAISTQNPKVQKEPEGIGNVFRFFHLGILDILLIVGAISFYIYVKFYRTPKINEKDGE